MSESICPFPFTQLFLHPDGRVIPCCWLYDYPVGDFKKQTLEEIWNGEPMRRLRKEFLSGETKTCARHLAHHGCHRIRPDLAPHVSLEEAPPFPMKRLDLMLNGQCNLECVMCDVWKAENGVYSENGFWEEGREKIFPHLVEIDAKGGEPFIQKDIYRLIDEVSRVNPGCRWLFTTNAHYRFSSRLKAALDQILIGDLSVSIDSLDPENYSKIRVKGDLKVVLRTLDDWIAYRNGRKDRAFDLNCNVVVQRANWMEIPRFVEFCREKNLVLFLLLLTDPSNLSLLTWSEDERCRILEFYFSQMRNQKERAYMRLIRPLLNSLGQERRGDLIALHSEVLSDSLKYRRSVAKYF